MVKISTWKFNATSVLQALFILAPVSHANHYLKNRPLASFSLSVLRSLTRTFCAALHWICLVAPAHHEDCTAYFIPSVFLLSLARLFPCLILLPTPLSTRHSRFITDCIIDRRKRRAVDMSSYTSYFSVGLSFRDTPSFIGIAIRKTLISFIASRDIINC